MVKTDYQGLTVKGSSLGKLFEWNALKARLQDLRFQDVEAAKRTNAAVKATMPTQYAQATRPSEHATGPGEPAQTSTQPGGRPTRRETANQSGEEIRRAPAAPPNQPGAERFYLRE